jgi:hypothetical protein
MLFQGHGQKPVPTTYVEDRGLSVPSDQSSDKLRSRFEQSLDGRMGRRTPIGMLLPPMQCLAIPGFFDQKLLGVT